MRYLVIVIIAIIAFSCGKHNSMEAVLDRADSLMTEQPDSALILLRSIDGTAFSHSSKLNARYALLLTQAQIKCHEPIIDDSLITIAVNYYSDNSEMTSRLLSYYYHGRVKYNSEDYALSLISMLNSYAIAQDINDTFWTAMSAREISAIYNITYNHADELKYAQIAYENFKSINQEPHLSYAAADLSAAYFNMNDSVSGLKILTSLIDSAKLNNNQDLLAELYRQLGKLHLKRNDYDQAKTVWEKICSLPVANDEDSIFLGTTYAGLRLISSANQIKNSYTNGNNISIASQYLTYTILKHSGRYEEAIEAGERLDSMTDSVFRRRVNQGITSAITSYFDQANRLVKANHERTQYRLWIVIAISIIVLLIIGWIFLWYRRQQTRTINTYITSLHELQKVIKSNENKALKAHEVASELISDHFKEFDTMFAESFEMDGNPQEQKRISNKVKSLIKTFSSDEKKIKELEDMADKHYNHAMSDIKRDFPTLTKGELRLFLYSLLGFSIKTQGVLLDKHTMNAIYSARRHFSDKLRKLEASKAEKYINLLNRQKP